MEIREIPIDGFERVARAEDPESGLLAFVAVHSTVLGPGCGGLRIWWYDSEDEALTDVLRLAEGMSYKSAIAHTGLGGGKSVLVCRRGEKTPERLRAMGRFVDAFQGQYRVAEDVGCTVQDLTVLREETEWVTGLGREQGGSGNPSPYTAHGCWLALRACAERLFGDASLRGRRIAVLGTGAVGGALVRRCAEEGAELVAFDLDGALLEGLVREHGITAASSAGELLRSECDLLAPCALGGIFDDALIPQLRCRGIAGAANNQLLEPRHGEMLHARGILYAPDYVVNAGGIINIGVELLESGYDEELALQRIARIPAALHELFDIAEREGLSTARAAQRLADRILEQGRKAAG